MVTYDWKTKKLTTWRPPATPEVDVATLRARARHRDGGLIVQGARDPRAPVGEALQLHDDLVQRGVPCELIVFPDEGGTR